MSPELSYTTDPIDPDFAASEEFLRIIVQRITVRDGKGRMCGTPGCQLEPTKELFRPRIATISAGALAGLIVKRKHGIFPCQLEVIKGFDTEALTKFDTLDPISATECEGGLSLTGGHHRTHEIATRVGAGRLPPETPVRILLHD